MSDYISRDLAIQANVSQVEFCKAEGLSFSGLLHIDSVINNLKLVPAADVVERKRGRWKIAPVPGIEEEAHICPFCRWLVYAIEPLNFCPNCGSRMECDS